jgi:hypothetical protein
MNSYYDFAANFMVTFFSSSLFKGFSMNQHAKSFSALLINVPSLYWKGSSSLLYYPKIASQSKAAYYEIDKLTYYSSEDMFVKSNVEPRIFPEIN